MPQVSQLESDLRSRDTRGQQQHLQEELRELRSDLRVLRDKNHQLVQDNIQLTEHLKDAERASLVSVASSNRSLVEHSPKPVQPAHGGLGSPQRATYLSPVGRSSSPDRYRNPSDRGSATSSHQSLVHIT